jgi:hypothetical protein
MITHPDIQDIFTFIPLSETKCTYDITDWQVDFVVWIDRFSSGRQQVIA